MTRPYWQLLPTRGDCSCPTMSARCRNTLLISSRCQGSAFQGAGKLTVRLLPSCKERLMKILCIVAALLILSATTVGKTSNRKLARSIYKDLDVMCRGGYGNRPSTDDACAVRTKVSALQRNQAARTPGNEQANANLAFSIYKDLDAMCRGGPGDRLATQQACVVRNKSSALLRNMGYCWRGAWWKKCRS